MAVPSNPDGPEYSIEVSPVYPDAFEALLTTVFASCAATTKASAEMVINAATDLLNMFASKDECRKDEYRNALLMSGLCGYVK
jgi:hypothetical protein